MTSELIVLITVPTQEEATRLGRRLVSDQLAVCVNIVPQVESIYRWEGKVCNDQEFLMIVKTNEKQYPTLETLVKEIHSYATPEIIALPIAGGSAEYLQWWRSNLLD
jgi:periplasmic divalent cation tolerance protein